MLQSLHVIVFDKVFYIHSFINKNYLVGTWYIQRLVETLSEEACSKPAGQEHLSLPDFKVRFSVTMLLQHSNGILTLASSLGCRESPALLS